MRSDVSTHSLAPMTINEAKALVRRYLGSFPSLNLHDPEIYIADLCALLCGYPLWVGEESIEKIKDTIKFPATRAEIKPLLEANVKTFRYAADWERDAQRQIGQRALPAPEGPPKLTYEQLRAKYDGPNGEKWGIANPEAQPRQKEQSAAQAKASLIAKYGQATIDAVPDASLDGNWK